MFHKIFRCRKVFQCWDQLTNSLKQNIPIFDVFHAGTIYHVNFSRFWFLFQNFVNIEIFSKFQQPSEYIIRPQKFLHMCKFDCFNRPEWKNSKQKLLIMSWIYDVSSFAHDRNSVGEIPKKNYQFLTWLTQLNRITRFF